MDKATPNLVFPSPDVRRTTFIRMPKELLDELFLLKRYKTHKNSSQLESYSDTIKRLINTHKKRMLKEIGDHG